MNIDFSSPVYAGNYIAGFGIAKGAKLLSIDYVSNIIRFSLIAEDGTVASEVNGISGDPVNQDTAAEDIRFVIAATNP